MSIFIIGVIAGIYGYLFPGNINVLVMELYKQKRFKFLVVIFFLIIFFELFYCIITLKLLAHFPAESSFQFYIKSASSVILLIIGFILIIPSKSESNNIDLTLKAGVMSIFIHPQQISFWLLFVLVTHPILNISTWTYELYILALSNVVGVLLILTGYMSLGNILINKLAINFAQIKTLIGLIYVGLAIFHMYQLAVLII